MTYYENKSESSVLWIRCKEVHNSTKHKFNMEARDCFGDKDANLSQITEASFIKNEHPEIKTSLIKA